MPDELQTITVTTEAQLDQAISTVDSNTGIAYRIDLIPTSGTITLTHDLPELNTNATVVIDGNGTTLDGGGTNRGFLIFSGNVSISSLTVADTRAQGGDGGGGSQATGGGGAGLGGGLFVASGATVTLNGVNFLNDQAIGGNGGVPGAYVLGGGGGGGMGGTGGAGSGAGYATNAAGGGGGGLGSTAAGGSGGAQGDDGTNGAPGIADGGSAAGSGGSLSAITRITWFVFDYKSTLDIPGGSGGSQGGGGGGGVGAILGQDASGGGGGGQTQGASTPGTPPAIDHTTIIPAGGFLELVFGKNALTEFEGYALTFITGVIGNELSAVVDAFGFVNGAKYLVGLSTAEEAQLANELSDAKILQEFDDAQTALSAGNKLPMAKFVVKLGLKTALGEGANIASAISNYWNAGGKQLYQDLQAARDDNYQALGVTQGFATSGANAPPAGAAGGFGGGGGGGGGAGGAGGFGGGGGGGGVGGQLASDGPSYTFRGGAGGFGGGGGGGGANAPGGYGGFGGGYGGFGGFVDPTYQRYFPSYGGGGGGLGAGGAVFVQQGGTLTFTGNDQFQGNSVQGGDGQAGAADGGAFGAGLFLQGNQIVTFAPAAGSVVSVGDIADEEGAIPTESTNRGTIVVNGQGTVRLGGTNTYAGPTVILNGTLELAPGGTITHSSVTIGAGGVLILDSGSDFTGTLDLSGYDPHATLGLLIEPGAEFDGTFKLPPNFAFALAFTPPVDLFNAGTLLLEATPESTLNGVTSYGLVQAYDGQTEFGVRSASDILLANAFAASNGDDAITVSIDAGVVAAPGDINETTFSPGSGLTIVGQTSTLGAGTLTLSQTVATAFQSADGIANGAITDVLPLTVEAELQGAGALSVSGQVTLTALSTFSGGLSLGPVTLAGTPIANSTTLDLRNALAAGLGTIAIGDGATLQVDGPALPGNVITEFGLAAAIDLTGIAAIPGNVANGADGRLLLPLQSGGTGTLYFGGDVPASTAFALRPDGSGGTLLTRLPQTEAEAPFEADFAQQLADFSVGGSLATPGATGTITETPGLVSPVDLTSTQTVTPAAGASLFIDLPLGAVTGDGLDVQAGGTVTLTGNAVFTRTALVDGDIPEEDTSSTAPLLTVQQGARVVLAGATLALTPDAGSVTVAGLLLAEAGTINAAINVTGGNLTGGNVIAAPALGQTLAIEGNLNQPLTIGGATLASGGTVRFGGTLTTDGGVGIHGAATLEINAGAVLGNGAIVLDSPVGEALVLDAGVAPSNTIDFAAGSGTLDLIGVTGLGTSLLTTGTDGIVLVPTPAGTLVVAAAPGTVLQAAPDGAGGTLLLPVQQSMTAATADQLLAAERDAAAMPALPGLSETVALAPAGGTLALTGDFQPFAVPAGLDFALTDGPVPATILVPQGVSASLGGGNSFSGGVIIDQAATLDLLNPLAAGSGTITLDGVGATLRIDGTVLPGNVIDLVADGQAIDLGGVALATGSVVYAGVGGALAVPGLTGALNLPQVAAGSGFVATPDGQGGTVLTALFPQQTITVANAAQLQAAIGVANGLTGDGRSVTIQFANGIGTLGLSSDLPLINLQPGVTLTIDGGGQVLDGGNVARGLLIYAGTVVVQDLTVADTVALGGAGGNGQAPGGGGAGLGGGIFVGSGANVTLVNTTVRDDRAVGGNGGVDPGNGVDGTGGGGGMGGAGGAASGLFAGGGGGLGRGASGGTGYSGSFSSRSAAYGVGGAGIASGLGSGGSVSTNRLLQAASSAGGLYGGGGSAGYAGAGGGIYGGQAIAADRSADYWQVEHWTTTNPVTGQPETGIYEVPLTTPGAPIGTKPPVGSYVYGSGIVNFGAPTAIGSPDFRPVAGSGGWGGGGGGASGIYFSGGAQGYQRGGSGGFGGGGGGGLNLGGNGGFGGGGGGTIPSAYNQTAAGAGGFGGGAGGNYQGGGGLGAGGGVFVESGGTLTVLGGVGVAGNQVAGGTGANAGGAAGSGIFAQGTVMLTFAPAAGTATTISDDISDMGGWAGGTLGVVMDGAGLASLDGTLSYVGPTQVESGTLALAGDASGVSGAVTIDPGATLALTGNGTGLSAPVTDDGTLLLATSGAHVTATNRLLLPGDTVANNTSAPIAVGGSGSLADLAASLDAQGWTTALDASGNLYVDLYGTWTVPSSVLSVSTGSFPAGYAPIPAYIFTQRHALSPTDAITIDGTTVTVGGSGTALDLVAAVNAAGITGVTADIDPATGLLQIVSAQPGLTLADAAGTPLEALGVPAGAIAPSAGVGSDITGTGSVVLDGTMPAVIDLSGAAAWTGGTQIDAGETLVLSGAFGGLGGTIDNQGALVLASAGMLGAELIGGGGVVQDSPGTLVLAGANALTGGVTIAAGALSLMAQGAAGTGTIAFAPGANGTLAIGAAALTATASGTLEFANAIAGFAPGDVIDIAVSGSAAIATLGAGNVVTVSSGGTIVTLQLDPAFSAGGANPRARSDGAGGIDVTLQAARQTETIASTADQQALLAAIDAGGSAQVLNEAYVVTVRAGAPGTGSADLVNLPSGDTLALNGASGATLPDGINVAAGAVTIASLRIAAASRVQAAAQVTLAAGVTLAAPLSLDAGAVVDADPGLGQVVTDTGGLAGAGSLVLNGAGTLVLSGSSGLTGGIVLGSGVLAVAGTASAGTGAIRFAAGHAATLRISPAAPPANVIDGFAPGDTIDIAGFTATGLSLGTNNRLSVTGGSGTIALQLDPTAGLGAYALVASSSGADTLVTLQPRAVSVATPAALNTAIAALDGNGVIWPGSLVAGLTLTADLTGANAVGGPLNPVALPTGEALLIAGGGHTIQGTGGATGLVLQTGSFIASDVTLSGFGANALSLGANVGLSASGLQVAGAGGVLLGNGAALTFTTAAGTTDDIAAPIADARGLGTGTGTGRLVLNGPGHVTLGAADPFAGGITIDQGTLELAAAGAAGSGGVTFNGNGLLVADSGAGAVTVSGLSLGQGTIDFAGVGPSALDIQSANGTTVVNGVTLAGIAAVAAAPDAAGGSFVSVPVSSFIARNAAGLAAILTEISAGGTDAAPDTSYVIGFSTGSLGLAATLPTIQLLAGSSLSILGDGATIDGGDIAAGLQVVAGNLSLSDLTLADFATTGDGGGLAMAGAGSLTLSNVTFNGDNASGSGGALALESSGGATLSNVTFTGDTAAVAGGALALEGSGSVTAASLTFQADGAAIGDDLSLVPGQTLTLASGTLGAGTSGIAASLGANAVLNLAPGAGNAVTVQGAIAGTGQIAIGRGSASLDADGGFSGGVSVAGTLDIGSASAAGTGTITLASGGVLRIDPDVEPNNVVAGLTSGGTLDAVGMAGAALSATGDVLTLTTARQSLSVTLAGTFDPATMLLTDSGGDELVTYVPRQLAAPDSLTPTTHDFGRILLTGASSTWNFYFLNEGNGEALQATVAGLPADFGSGSTDINPQYVGGLPVTFAPTSDGVFTAQATVALSSVAAGRLPVLVGTTPLTLTGTVYAAPQILLSANTVDFGTIRGSGVGQSETITVANGTTADPYQETALLQFGSPSTNGPGLTIAAPQTTTYLYSGGSLAIPISVAADATGTLAASLLLTPSIPASLPRTPLAPVTITASGTVYAQAMASLPATLNFGFVHAGDVIDRTLVIENTATGALTDALVANLGTVSGPFSLTGAFGTLAADRTGSVTVGLTAGAAGALSGAATIDLASHDPVLSDLVLAPGTVQLLGTVDNYATAALSATGGPASFTGSGNSYTLNFGTLIAAATETLSLANLAIGPADLLGAQVAVADEVGFANAGFDSIAGIGAGQADTALTISGGLGTGGTIHETLVISPAGSNASGYIGTLAPITLTVTGTVPTQDFTVSDYSDLNTVLSDIDQGGALSAANTAYRILFDAPGGTLQFAGQLAAINLAAGSSVTFIGNGETLDGAGNDGLFVTAGTVALQDLTLADMTARGGSPQIGGGGGGGAGLGGGLFVGAGAAASLMGVSFIGDRAVGGNGSRNAGIYAGSGGGLNGRMPGGQPSGTRIETDYYNGEPVGNDYGGGSGNPQGGFGGGGGAGSYTYGGNGGFGGGGGSDVSITTQGNGAGGYGAGGAYAVTLGIKHGGGGLGAGADIFVQQGGSIALQSGTLAAGSVAGGSPGGEGLGPTIFLQGTQTLTLDTQSGQVTSIAGGIADQRGNGGIAALLITGSGTVSLTADSTYTGGTEIRGRLEIGSNAAAGAGTITLDAGGVLGLAAGVDPANTIAGFGAGTTIDVEAIAGATATVSGSMLTVAGAAGTVALALSGPALSNYGLLTTSDGSGGTDVSYVSGPVPEALAEPVLSGAVNLGVLPLGGSAESSVTITNPLLQGGDTLVATLGALSAGLAGSGGTLTLGPGASGTLGLTFTALTEGVGTAAAGLRLANIDPANPGATPTPLSAEAVTVAATVYALATPVLPAAIDLGSTRQNDAALTGSIALSDGGADPWREALVYGASVTSGDLMITEATSGTVAAGGSTAVAVALATGQAGTLNATADVALTSAGSLIQGLSDTMLNDQTVAVTGTVFVAAAALLNTGTIDFGIVHTGDTVGQTVLVTNTASGALTDLLEGTIAALPQGFTALPGQLIDIAAGQSGTLGLSLNTGTSGIFAGTATLAVTSHDSALADLALPGATLALAGTVDAYATLEAAVTGHGLVTRQGDIITVDLGTIDGAQSVGIMLGNAATGQADLLSGSLSFTGGTGVSASGLDGFALGAGQVDAAPTITLSPLIAGVDSGTLVVNASGSNASGFDAAVAGATIVVTGTVAAGAYADPTPIGSGDDLAAAIAAFSTGGSLSAPDTTYTITLAAGADLLLDNDLPALELQSGSTLDVIGNGATVDGGDAHQGFVDIQGGLVLNNLVIADAAARGTDGGSGADFGRMPNAYSTGRYLRDPSLGGGGGAGLGGGLFVAAGGQAQLNGVTFQRNSATGGNGGSVVQGDYSSYSHYGASGHLGGTEGLALGSGSFGRGGYGPYGAGGFGGGASGGIAYGPRPAAGYGGGSGGVAAAHYRFTIPYGYYYSYRYGGGGGGGGLGAGGNIFVQAGGGLAIGAGALYAGSVAGGQGNDGGSNGQALGSNAFLQANTVSLDPPAHTTLTLTGDIAGPGSGSALVLNGAGTVVMAGTVGFGGAIDIQSGTLLVTGDAAGLTGNIADDGTLVLRQTARGSATTSVALGLRPGDQIGISVPEGYPFEGWSDSVTLRAGETLAQLAQDLQNTFDAHYNAETAGFVSVPGPFQFNYNAATGQISVQVYDLWADTVSENPITLTDNSGNPLEVLGLPTQLAGPVTTSFQYPLSPTDALLVNNTLVTVGGVGSLNDLVAAINDAGIAGVSAALDPTTGQVEITASSGGLYLSDANGTPLEELGLQAGQQAWPLPGTLSGNGTVIIDNGPGSEQVLDGAVNGSGTTVIEPGNTLLLNGSGAEISGTIVNDGVIVFGQAAPGHFGGVITGSGTLIFQSNVTLLEANTSQGGVQIGRGGDVTVSNDGNLGAAGSTLTLLQGSTLAFATSLAIGHPVTVSGDPTFDVAAGQTITIAAGISDGASAGDVVLQGGGELVLAAAGTYSGGTSIDGGTLDLAVPNAAGSGTIAFGDGPATLRIEGDTAPDNVIADFVSGDTIDLGGIAHSDTETLNYTVATGELDIIDNAATIAALFFGPGNAAVDDPFHINQETSGTGIVITNDYVPCFLRGTGIRAEQGEVPVERLSVGDRIVTATGAVKPIVWIGSGRRRIKPARRTAATPIIVRRGALADNVPHRDLYVTKGHSLFIDDVLIPAEYLVNHRSIQWDDRSGHVEFYHIAVDGHDVLFADGAMAETYRDDGNRDLFDNANDDWDEPAKPPYAPVLTGGPIVDTIWRRLLDRSGPRPGLPLTDDPDLHLLADGERIDGIHRDAIVSFALPRPPKSLRVVSRAGSPAELGLARDPRSLGVAVRQIRFWQGRRVQVIDASDPLLTDGFHDFEPEQGMRWTDGDGRLAEQALSAVTDTCTVDLVLAGSTTYPLLAGHPVPGG